MQYRIDRLNNIYIRLNDGGSMDIIKIEYWPHSKTIKRHTRTRSYQGTDWSMIYNNYSHSNKREFEEAEKLAQI